MVFDGTGAALADADVLVEDGRVVDVGSDLDGDEGIDCSGKAVLPGLFDTHVHLTSRYEDFDEVRVLHEPFSEPFFRVAENMRRTLALRDHDRARCRGRGRRASSRHRSIAHPSSEDHGTEYKRWLPHRGRGRRRSMPL